MRSSTLPAGTLTYARAGHTPMVYLPGPAHCTPARRCSIPSGMVVGLRIDGAAEKFAELLEEERMELGAGDVIVLYTDGITEAMNAESDLFGDSRLSRIVEEHGHLDSAELRERILREIEAFVGDADQHDDMTMILLKVEPRRRGRACRRGGQVAVSTAGHMSDLVVIFRTQSPIEADVVRGLLETHGIDTFVKSRMPLTSFPMSVHELRVTVKPEDAARARADHREPSRRPRAGRGASGAEFEPLEAVIGYRFRDRGLLEHALTHRSRVHEDASGGVFDNESLEFLGDSVLGFVIADMLFREFPQHNEGQKSKLSASIVSAASLARLGERIELGAFLILGRGEEKTGGRRKHALIADSLRGADRRDLSRRRHRAGAGVHRAPVRGSDRRGAADAAPRRRSPRTTSQRCRSGCSRATGACRSTGSRPRSAPPTAGGSRSRCSSAASPSRGPKARARRRRRRPRAKALALLKQERVARRSRLARRTYVSAPQSISMIPQGFVAIAVAGRRPGHAPAPARPAAAGQHVAVDLRATSSSVGGVGRQCSRTQSRSIGSAKL